MKRILSILLLFLLAGCSKEDYTIHFADEMILDYGTNLNSIHLIAKIGDVEITDEMIDGNKIILNDFIITCDEVDTNRIGQYEVKYVTNEEQKRIFSKKIIVQDISSPTIRFKEKVLSLTSDEYAKFDFDTFINVTDNWQEDKPTVSINLEKVDDVSYNVHVSAIDRWKNEDTKSFLLKIEEKISSDGSTAIKQDDSQNNHPSSNIPPSSNSQSSSASSSAPSSNSNPVVKPSNKDFLFADGYTMENVTGVCTQALIESGASGMCIPIQDEDGIYLGMRLTFE